MPRRPEDKARRIACIILFGWIDDKKFEIWFCVYDLSRRACFAIPPLSPPPPQLLRFCLFALEFVYDVSRSTDAPVANSPSIKSLAP